jgi:hypothetical protein
VQNITLCVIEHFYGNMQMWLISLDSVHNSSTTQIIDYPLMRSPRLETIAELP